MPPPCPHTPVWMIPRCPAGWWLRKTAAGKVRHCMSTCCHAPTVQWGMWSPVLAWAWNVGKTTSQRMRQHGLVMACRQAWGKMCRSAIAAGMSDTLHEARCVQCRPTDKKSAQRCDCCVCNELEQESTCNRVANNKHTRDV